MKFVNLYDEVYANIKEGVFRNIITFAENWTPVPGVDYHNLRIHETMTGQFKYEGKTYRVARAHHPDYDFRYKDVRVDNTADIMDQINYQCNSDHDRNDALDNPFAVLASAVDKESLPIQEKMVTSHIKWTYDAPGIGATVLVPATYYNTGRKMKQEIDFEVNDKSTVFKISRKRLCTGHRILSHSLAIKGMIVFVKKNVRIPELVGLRITGFTKSGSAAFADPIHGTDGDLYKYYDLAIAHQKEEE